MNAPTSTSFGFSGITAEQLAAIAAILDPTAPIAAVTLSDIWIPYLAYKKSRLRPRSVSAITSRMRPVLATLGDRQAASIKWEDADAFAAEMTNRHRARQATAITRSHAAQCLQGLITVLTWAVKRRMLKENPLAGYEAAVPCNRRSRVFTPREISDVLFACKKADCPDAFVVVAVMKDSGVRPIELMSLKREHVDLKSGLLTIPATIAKTGVQRSVALAADGIKALRAYSKGRKPTDPLFARCCYSTMSSQWRKACEVAAIRNNKDGTPPLLYSLRHTLATRLATELGFQPFELAQWMGWSNIQQAATYVKTTETALLSSAGKLNAANIARPPTATNRPKRKAPTVVEVPKREAANATT